jgi:hypothetical protein
MAKRRSSQVKTRMPVLMAAVGAGAGFLIGWLLPMMLSSLLEFSPDRADQLSWCCMTPLLTIAGGLAGFFYGRQLDQQQGPPKR